MKMYPKIDLDPEEMIRYVCDFVGIEEIGSRTKDNLHVMARVLVSYCLLYQGITNTFVGKIILRKHCSVTHYKKLIRDDPMTHTYIEWFKKHMEGKGVYIPNRETWIERMKVSSVGYSVIRDYNNK